MPQVQGPHELNSETCRPKVGERRKQRKRNKLIPILESCPFVFWGTPGRAH